MKFDRGARTLSTLMREPQGSSDDLRSLIQQLVRAGNSLQGVVDATAAYPNGDRQMAAEARHRTLSAPEVGLPGVGKA
ncbi:DUF6507 family protein [Streptomyces sp. JNUCC 63]